MEELLRELVDTLKTTHADFQSGQEGAARALIAQQPGLYQTLARAFNEVPFLGTAAEELFLPQESAQISSTSV
ncbi:hypothetical protein LXM94_23790 [Rhizobium sp. TRM95111]|uniref:hypothetical protein n=1 Tax=Rhizobium alarense TaxID=2846851 RepID=UPI001F33505F|nr:hypothetical protein [Rhizobium alarense]MCF3642990.1 hypothetical protein [Rhizobium alarense]